ncbi:MAG: T9SS type A sorting domain-containing protein [Flavobacteriales bacterium]|nr:T9SS type A sorting domain-containing protein [Flavobacteriales bacterium]
MKKITLFMGLVLATTVSFSQVVVKLTSVPCNTGLEGTYPFQYAGNLDGSSTDWGLPNIFDGNNAVSGPLEMINDGTPGIVTGVGTPPLNNVPLSALGCDTNGNITQDLTGKIAVVYRGTCQFGLKALNAQKRGAIGVIIINHTGDAVGMAGGTYGTRVTIPVVQIGRVAGDDLYLALNTCAPGTVTAFIGSKVGVFTNDMGSSIADIVMTESSTVPADLAIPTALDLGFFAFNYGVNAQNGVTASVVVKKDGSTIHTNTSAPLNFVAPAGTVIDSQYFDLGQITLPSTANGVTVDVANYEFTYTLNIVSTDEDPADNMFKFNYRVTNNEDIFAKSTTNAAGIPVHSTAYSLNETTTQYDDWEACINYRGPYTGNVTGMYFTGLPVGSNIDFEVVEIRAYRWTEAGYTNLSVAAPTFAALNQEASGTYFWDHSSNGNLEGQMVYQEFDSPFDLSTVAGAANLKGVLFCVYNASDSVRIGFDTKVDYSMTVNNYLQPISPVKTLANGAAARWYAAGFGYDATAAIAAKFDVATSVKNDVASNVVASPYPNPAANLLRVPVRNGVKGDVTIEVYDLLGKLVISEKQTIGNEALRVNVASISNGAYVFNLTFADGSKDTFKVSVNR